MLAPDIASILGELRESFNREHAHILAVPAADYVIMWGDQPLYTDKHGTIGSVISRWLDRATLRIWHTTSRDYAEDEAARFRISAQSAHSQHRVYVLSQPAAYLKLTEQHERLLKSITDQHSV